MKNWTNDFVSYLLILIIIYTIFTLTEWLIHRYIMHSKKENYLSRYHLMHHLSVNPDNMRIKINNRGGKEQNLCLDHYALTPFVLILPIFCCLLYLFTNKVKFFIFSIVIFTVFIFLNIYLWNGIHSYMHNEIGTERCNFPSLNHNIIEKNKDNWYIKWVIKNHTTHHKVKGDKKGNFNIIYPGADYLLGTYNY